MDSEQSADSVAPDTEGLFTDIYDQAVESLMDVPVQEKYLGTSGGQTHLLTAGDDTDPPLVVFQGGNVTTPITLSWVQALAEEYHLIAPDTPGQPGKTTVETPEQYAPWVADLLDSLDLQRAGMVGISHGAGIVLETAVDAPERIDAAALVVPAGFGTAFSPTLLRIVLPSVGYRFLPQRRLLHQALAPMFTQPVSSVDETILETVGRALRTGELRAAFPGPDDLGALSGFDAPTLVITAEDDPFFPGTRTCKQAAGALSSLDECLMLTGERHFLSPAAQSQATERIQSFLAGELNGSS